MAHMVQCVKLGHEAEGLDLPPLPGALGMKIYNNVSKEAWEQWKHLQTKRRPKPFTADTKLRPRGVFLLPDANTNLYASVVLNNLREKLRSSLRLRNENKNIIENP